MSGTQTSKPSPMGVSTMRLLIAFDAACLVFMAAAAAIGAAGVLDDGTAAQLRNEVVGLNQLAQDGATADASSVLAQAQDALRSAADAKDRTALLSILAVFGTGALCLVALSGYLLASIVWPFARLQGFAENVAAGDLDTPLAYERSNPFGKFAWAFDHMRIELKRARTRELAAIESNKTVIASLAHDLRTPVASIRAYAEALDLGLARTDAERREYARVIERRCCEVSQLVDDMLTHSLAELDRISVECAPVPAASLLRQVAEGFDVSEVKVASAAPATIAADERRLRQAIENLLVNAAKYASGSNIEVTGAPTAEGFYRINVRDFGPGMAPEDLPFAFDRFYRGSNAADIPGSGLGLFIVKHLIERMGGTAGIANAHPGLRITLDVPLEDSPTPL